jgi:hypothetical protein
LTNVKDVDEEGRIKIWRFSSFAGNDFDLPDVESCDRVEPIDPCWDEPADRVWSSGLAVGAGRVAFCDSTLSVNSDKWLWKYSSWFAVAFPAATSFITYFSLIGQDVGNEIIGALRGG